jgi:short-subunit dehydrogenase
MRRRGWGRIVNIASLGGKRAVPHMLPYAASKFALRGLSHGLRAELAKDGIVVTTICPALMNTGSPRHASFKGRHRQEYAWFSILDSLPLIALDAETAAQRIMKACRDGVTEADLAGTGTLSVKLQSLAPGTIAGLLALVNRILPDPGGIGSQAAKGYESTSSLSPSLLTRRGEKAARANNELVATD